jgi:hypothetical protein
MDRFRIESLYRLLRTEPIPRFRRKIINVLNKKLNILIKGYEKRNWAITGENPETLKLILSFRLVRNRPRDIFV